MLKEVRCPTCNSLFGIEQPNGTLAIKHREIYRTISGSIWGPCRRCGAQVRWPDSLLIEKGR